MNRSLGKIVGTLLVVIALSGVTLGGASVVWAQQKAANVKKQILGSWTLVSVVVEQEGTKREVYGPNPKGFLSYDRNGHMSLMLLHSNLPRITSNNRESPTPEEAAAVARGILAYYGTYTIDAEGNVIHHIEASSFANWNGADQKRLITISGDELRVTNPTPPLGGGTAYLVFRRAR